MNLYIDIQKKRNKILYNKITKPSEIFKLKEIQEIKDAIQEHLLFLGLDKSNNIRNINLIGVGNTNGVMVDSKNVLRIALMNCNEKVILVHNHPSNVTSPSSQDKEITNRLNKFFKVFNIELLDHIIVGENEYTSMRQINAIDWDYEDSKTKLIDNTFLVEENKKLKENIKILTNNLQKYKKLDKEIEEEFE